MTTKKMKINMKCHKCKFSTDSRSLMSTHSFNAHKEDKYYCVDLIKLGIIKRKLTQSESQEITKKVMAMNLKNSNTRFMMVVLLTIDKTNIEKTDTETKE